MATMRSGRRAVLLVLDGLGAGEMVDRPAEDAGSHTLAHVVEQGRLELPNLRSLGLANAVSLPGIGGVERPAGAFGLADLGYPGADSQLGHQELIGTAATVRLRLLSEVRTEVVDALTRAGYRVEPALPGISALVVDGNVLVADNIEAKTGLSINVTGSLDDQTFDELLHIGTIVRAVVPVPRVIVVGGRGFGMDSIRAHLKERTPGQIGVDTPALGVYDDHFQVRHLSAEATTDRQLPSLVAHAGGEVVLVGKAADVIPAERAVRVPLVSTAQVLETTAAHLRGLRSGLVIANIQETDLAGHEQDVQRFASVLAEVDSFLPELVGLLRHDDVLVVTADHGNDPTIGHSQHTRERVPVLVAGPAIAPVDLGVRGSLADIGATLAELLGVGTPEAGTTFARHLS